MPELLPFPEKKELLPFPKERKLLPFPGEVVTEPKKEEAKGLISQTVTEFERLGLGLKTGLQASAAHFYRVLDTAANRVADVTGFEKGGAFEKIAQDLERASAPENIEDTEGFNAALGRVLGGAPITIGMYAVAGKILGPVAGFAFLDALAESDEGAKKSIIAGFRGATFGGVLKGAHILSKGQRVTGLAGIGALTTEGTPEERAASALLFAGLGAVGPKEGKTVKRAVADLKRNKDIQHLDKLVEKAKKAEAEVNVLEGKPIKEIGDIPPEKGVLRGIDKGKAKEVVEDFFGRKGQEKFQESVKKRQKVEKGKSTKEKLSEFEKAKLKKDIGTEVDRQVEAFKEGGKFVEKPKENILESDSYYHSPSIKRQLESEKGSIYSSQIFVEKGNDPTHYIGKSKDVEKIILPPNPRIVALDRLAKQYSEAKNIPKDKVLSDNKKLNDALNYAWRHGYDVVDGGTQYRAVAPNLVRKKIGKIIGKEESKPTGAIVQKVPGVSQPSKKPVKATKLPVVEKKGKVVGIVEARKGIEKAKEKINPFLEITDLPLYDNLLEKPEYFRDAKGMVGKVVMMQPSEYITRSAEILGVSIKDSMRIVDPKRVDRYAQDMRAGDKFPMLSLEHGTKNQEGRHRALAAQKLGIEVPVLEIFNTDRGLSNTSKLRQQELFNESKNAPPKDPTTINMLGSQVAYEKSIEAISKFLTKSGLVGKQKGDFENVDMRRFIINELLQTPRDIGKSHAEMRKIVAIQDARVLARNHLVEKFYQGTKTFWDMKLSQRKKVGAWLIRGDKDHRTYTQAELRRGGLNDTEIKAYNGIRRTLNGIRDRIIRRNLEAIITDKSPDAGVAFKFKKLFNGKPDKSFTPQELTERGFTPEEIEAYGKMRAPIEDMAGSFKKWEGYIPHKRYGKFGVRGVNPKSPEETLFLEMFEGGKSGTSKMKARRARAKLQEENPNMQFNITKFEELAEEFFEDFKTKNFEGILEQIKGQANSKNIDQIVDQFYKNQVEARGFGRHFIERKDIPGYSKDVDRVLADYLNQYAGYETKYDAAQGMWRALGAVPLEKPNLYKYASEYTHYVLSERTPEYQRLRNTMFVWYLGGNVKSAAVNATQNWITAAPLLTERSGKSGYAQILKASKDVIKRNYTPNEERALGVLHEKGITKDVMTAEFTGANENLFNQHFTRPTNKALRFMFGQVEIFNRESSGLAMFRAERAKGSSFQKSIDEAVRFIEDTHFVYGKGDRPRLARGIGNPLFIFRTFLINYVQFLKNRLKNKGFAAFAKSIGTLMAFGGTSAIPFSGTLNDIYGWATGEDFEAQTRQGVSDAADELLGKDEHERLKQGIERGITLGLPSALLGVDFSGSIGMGDIIPGPTAKDWLGVIGDLPDRAHRVSRDIRTWQQTGKSGPLWRAVEDLSPEFLKNPMQAIRLFREADTTRGGERFVSEVTGKPLPTLTPLELVGKIGGFQPVTRTERYKASQVVLTKKEYNNRLRGKYLDAMMVAINNRDNTLINEIQADVAEYNEGKKLEDMIILFPQAIVQRAIGKKMSNTQTKKLAQKIDRLFGITP